MKNWIIWAVCMWWWGVKGHFVVHEICVIRRSNDVTFWIVTLFDALSNL